MSRIFSDYLPRGWNWVETPKDAEFVAKSAMSYEGIEADLWVENAVVHCRVKHPINIALDIGKIEEIRDIFFPTDRDVFYVFPNDLRKAALPARSILLVAPVNDVWI